MLELLYLVLGVDPGTLEELPPQGLEVMGSEPLDQHASRGHGDLEEEEEEERERRDAVFELTHHPQHGEQHSHYGVTMLEDKIFVSG